MLVFVIKNRWLQFDGKNRAAFSIIVLPMPYRFKIYCASLFLENGSSSGGKNSLRDITKADTKMHFQYARAS